MTISERPTRHSAARALAPYADQRGAIMVLGVFMCACLTGMLWYVIGIGDAVVYRERLQEGADAVAFSAATLHARGMNLIVLINLLMACVLGIRVAMKAAQAAAVVVGGICAVIPGLQGIAGECFEVAGDLQTAIADSRQAINDTLKGLSRAQVGIKMMVPGAALAGSVQVGAKYRPRVSEAAAANKNLIQGLPVEDGNLDQLCLEAGESGPKLVEWMIASITHYKIPDQAMGRFNGLIGKGIEKGGAYFCELGSGANTPPDFSSDLDAAAKEGCAKEQGQLKTQAEQASSEYSNACRALGAACGGGTDKALTSAQKAHLAQLDLKRSTAEAAENDFDDKKCKQDKRAQSEQRMKDGSRAETPAPKTNDRELTPKQVKASYVNGGDDGQLLGVAKGDTSLLRIAPKGVRSGAWKSTGADAKSLSESFAFAQAEFFYDCSGAWKSEGCNGDKRDEGYAMWRFRWRARLRRYNSGDKPALEHISSVLLGASALKGELTRLPKLNWSTDENALLLRDLGRAVQQDVIVH